MNLANLRQRMIAWTLFCNGVFKVDCLMIFGVTTSSSRKYCNAQCHDKRSQSLLATYAETNSNWNVLPMGEADICFQRGAELEKTGQARAAHATFHEAATLYQCFLDQQLDSSSSSSSSNDATTWSSQQVNYDNNDNGNNNNEFGHVTGHSIRSDCQSVLAYTCVRLAHLSHDFLGDSKAAARLYKEAATIDPCPSSVSFDGMGIAIEASGGGAEALEAYTKAHQITPTDKVIAFHLAVALERSGQVQKANTLLDPLLRRGGEDATATALLDSWGYVRWHTRRVKNDQLNLHRGTRAMLKLGLDAARDLIFHQPNGLVCEFGVGSGRSMRILQELLPLTIPLHGFDTFTGLPMAWGNEPAGAYSTAGIIPKIEGNVRFHQGLFKQTIPQFLKSLPQDQPLAFANIDCDLYSSTCDVLESIHNRIVPGTVLVFDEYLINPSWRQDEFRAWRECCKRFGWRYEYLAFSLSSKQAVVRVIEA